jgi:hypothetical protein
MWNMLSVAKGEAGYALHVQLKILLPSPFTKEREKLAVPLIEGT